MASHAQYLRIQPLGGPQAEWCGRTVELVEKLHRGLQELVKDELDRRKIQDINGVQALMLYHFSEESLAPGDLRARGHYQGTNATYNLKKLVTHGYVDQKPSETVRRSVRLSLTVKGEGVRAALRALFCRHEQSMGVVADLPSDSMVALNTLMGRLERFWVDQVRFRL